MEYVWKSSLLISFFKELHKEQEYYWPDIIQSGAAVVSTNTSFNVILKNQNDRFPYPYKSLPLLGGASPYI